MAKSLHRQLAKFEESEKDVKVKMFMNLILTCLRSVFQTVEHRYDHEVFSLEVNFYYLTIINLLKFNLISGFQPIHVAASPEAAGNFARF